MIVTCILAGVGLVYRLRHPYAALAMIFFRYLFIDWLHQLTIPSLAQTAGPVCIVFVLGAGVALWRAKRFRIVVEYDSRE